MPCKWSKYTSSQWKYLQLTSSFNSALYYNSEIWKILYLIPQLLLLSALTKVLKISQRNPDPMQFYINIQKSCKRALPDQMIECKHAVSQHKLYNQKLSDSDCVELHFNQILTSCQAHLQIFKSNIYKLGNNRLATRLTILIIKSFHKT